MTTRKRFKRLVRTRAAKTGESYTAALRHFRDQTSRERAMSSNPEEAVDIRCSFCGKHKDQVQKIVAGPGVFICDECVLLCLEIVRPSERDAGSAVVVRGAQSTPPEERPPLDPTLVGRVRQHVEEFLGQIAAGDEAGTPLLTSIEVTTTPDGFRVDLVTPRPRIVIGPRASRVEQLRSRLAHVVDGHVVLNVVPAGET